MSTSIKYLIQSFSLSISLILLICTVTVAEGMDRVPAENTAGLMISATDNAAQYKVTINPSEQEETTIKVVNTKTKEVVYSERLVSDKKFEKTYKLDNLVSGDYTIEVRSGLKTSVKEVHVR